MSALIGVTLAQAQPPAVPTQHNDNARTGANTHESLLTPASVNVSRFGKLFKRPLDADINGQPLWVPGLTINGDTHNVVFFSTSNNHDNSPSSVYAFDADNPALTDPLWRHVFPENSGQWTTCTPVIDTERKILFVLTKETSNTGPHKLHALNLLTGDEMPGSPITIAGSVPGNGAGSVNGVVSFDTTHANCRTALLLLNGTVYFGMAHCTDGPPYHGWIFGYRYDSNGFTQTGIFNTCPDGSGDGVWQAGNGLTADSNGNIYCGTSNGTFNVPTGGKSYGMCYLKLSTPDLKVLDYFCPYDQAQQSKVDLDLGSTGLLNIPGTNRLFAGRTKFGSAFLIDSTSLGGFVPNGPDKVIQRIDGPSGTFNVFQNPVVWDAGATKYVYLWPRNSQIQQFKYETSVGQFDPWGIWKQPDVSTIGGTLVVSANGTKDGILWAAGYDGVLYAYDAGDVSLPLLWASNQNKARDAMGPGARFNYLTAVNGKVYVSGYPHTLMVYGLLPATRPVTLLPTDDTYVRSGVWADKNFGIVDLIAVRKDSDGSASNFNRCAYLKFDLSGITAAPKSAVLNLTVLPGASPVGATETVEVYSVPDTSWTEKSLTWNNAPGLNRADFSSAGKLLTTRSIVIDPSVPVSIDLTGFVASHIGQVVTLQIKDSASENLYLTLTSKENKGAKPNLVITP